MKLLRRRDLYTHAGDHYRRWYRFLTIPTLILTASTGLVSSAWPEAVVASSMDRYWMSSDTHCP